MNKHGAAPTGLSSYLAFGLGDFALNLFWQGTGFYLFFFETNVVGLSGTIVGSLFLIASIWDAVSDPMMGYIAERTRSRWGPYRPYLLFGAVPLALSFALMFAPLRMANQTLQIAYTLGVLLAFRTAYTVVSIPYSTLGTRVARNFDGRTRLAGIRMYLGFLGGVGISFTAKHLQETHADATAFALMGGIAGAVAVVVLVICFAFTRTPAEPGARQGPPPDLRTCLKAMVGNRPFLLIVGGISFVTVATSIVGQTMLYFFESNLGDRSAGNSAIIIMGAAPLVTIPLWSAIALKIGKRHAWVLGSLIAAAGLAPFSLGLHGSIGVAHGLITLVVIGLSAFAVLLWSTLPDTIEYGHYSSGVKIESFLIGMASSFQKLTIGVSAFLTGVLLDGVGYQAAAPVGPDTAAGIRTIFALIPMLALLGSAAVMMFYPVTAEAHAAIVSKLREREQCSSE